MAGIERIHWGVIGVRRYRDETGSVFALWPDPIDSDVCFKEAGFERFADSDETWDADFESVLQGVLETLGDYGSPVVTGERPIWKPSLVARVLRSQDPELRLSERLALVAHDDQFAPCRVDFGTPVRAVAFVSDGHPIVWIWLQEDVAGGWREHLRAVASGRPVRESSLEWRHLLPRALPFPEGPWPTPR